MKLSYRNPKNAQAISAYWGKPLDKPDWFSVNALASDEPEIFIYSVVGWPFVDEEELVRAMAGMKDKHILCRINSPGGDVYSGMSLFNAFANHPGGVTVRIEGMAASIASIIAMGGKKVEAYSNTMVMVHNAMILTCGNHNELREIADIIEKISGQMCDIYTGKCKKGKKEMKSMMDEETYMTAQEALSHGFIDTILKSGKGAKAEFDLPFSNVPDYFKASDKELTERDAEKILRDAGFSRHKAKAILAGRKDGDEPIPDPPVIVPPIIPPQDDSAIIAALKNNIKLFGGN
jgi:ATP-dependent Clp protease protease subunit